MFKTLNTIEKIQAYFPLTKKELIILFYENNISKIRKYQNNLIINEIHLEGKYIPKLSHKKLIFEKNLEELIFIEPSKLEINRRYFLKGDYFLNTLQDNLLVLRREKENVMLFLIEDKNEKWNIDNNPKITVFNNNLYGFPEIDKRNSKYSLSKLDRYNIKCGKTIWTKDVSEIASYYDIFDKTEKKGEVKKIIGCLDDVLWLGLTNQMVIGIDNNTGENKFIYRNIPEFKKPILMDAAIPKPECMQIDENTQSIIGCSMEFYWEINIKEQKLHFFDMRNEFSNKEISAALNDFVFDDEYIFFVDQHRGKIGALNRKVKTLGWVYKFTENDDVGVIIDIKYSENRLYVRDNKNTLHIFEKQ